MFPLKLKKAGRAFLSTRDMRALSKGVAPSLEHKRLLRRLSGLKMVVDVGANRGQFVLETLKWHPGASIIAVEPLAQDRSILLALTEGFDNVRVEPVALGEREAMVDIHVSRRSDSSSLLAPTGIQTGAFPGTDTAFVDKVPMRRLDGLLSAGDIAEPALCKIDVQGYELAALRGFGLLLDRFAYLLIELSNAPLYQGQPNSALVISYLSGKGFEIADITNICRDREGRCLQADFLFQRAPG